MFSQSMLQFSDNLDILREFIATAAPYLEQKAEEYGQRNLDALWPLVVASNRMDPDRFPLPDGISQENIDAVQDGDIEIIPNEAPNPGAHSFQLVFHDSDTARAFYSAASKARRGARQIEHLYEGSFVSLIATVEWFLSSLLHQYFKNYPDAVEGNDKVFSLVDLKSFDTIEQARTYLVDSSVEGVLRGSFSDWIAFLKSRLNLSCGYLDQQMGTLVETFQRRNLLMHNGGVVNNIYFAKVDAAQREGLSTGMRIRVDPTYLDDRISLLERSFLLVCAELWKRLEPENEARASVMTQIAYHHLVAERWGVAEGLSYFMMHDAKLPESHRLTGTVNYWQSLKWQNRFDAVQAAVKKEDFSAKTEIFRLAQAALLDDVDAFFGLLPHALESGAVPEGALAEWPLFREMRKDDRMKPFLEVDSHLSATEPPSDQGTEIK